MSATQRIKTLPNMRRLSNAISGLSQIVLRGRHSIGMLVLLVSGHVFAAEEYFKDCDKALAEVEFSSLKAYLSDNKAHAASADRCMRLNNTEFLYTTGGGSFENNLYYCKINPRASACVEDKPGNVYPGLKFVRQFSGDAGKQYVLTSTSWLSDGVESSGYQIFNLVPKRKAVRGYVFYNLDIGTNISYSEDSSSDPCAGLKSVEQATEVKSAEILNEGTSSVRLAFHVTSTNCSTKNRSDRMRKYELVDGSFRSEKETESHR